MRLRFGLGGLLLEVERRGPPPHAHPLLARLVWISLEGLKPSDAIGNVLVQIVESGTGPSLTQPVARLAWFLPFVVIVTAARNFRGRGRDRVMHAVVVVFPTSFLLRL